MPDAQIAMQPAQHILREHLIDQTHALIRIHPALWSLCIRHRDTARFLPPVLQRKQPIVDGRRDIPAIRVIHAKHATGIMKRRIVFYCLI